MDQRPFLVEVELNRTVQFTVDARTPEEAESIVEQWIGDGEHGELTSETIEHTEATPAEAFGDEVLSAGGR